MRSFQNTAILMLAILWLGMFAGLGALSIKTNAVDARISDLECDSMRVTRGRAAAKDGSVAYVMRGWPEGRYVVCAKKSMKKNHEVTIDE